jgi:hypothetical protein
MLDFQACFLPIDLRFLLLLSVIYTYKLLIRAFDGNDPEIRPKMSGIRACSHDLPRIVIPVASRRPHPKASAIMRTVPHRRPISTQRSMILRMGVLRLTVKLRRYSIWRTSITPFRWSYSRPENTRSNRDGNSLHRSSLCSLDGQKNHRTGDRRVEFSDNSGSISQRANRTFAAVHSGCDLRRQVVLLQGSRRPSGAFPGRGDPHPLHPCGDGGVDAQIGVFKDQAVGGRNAQAFGSQQEAIRRGLAVHVLF